MTYKETHANAKIDPTAAWTGTWRDPRFSPPSDGGRPENALTGTIFTVNCCTYTITVPEVFGKARFWRNTTVATLGAGQTATLAANTLGYEWDEDLDNGFRPDGLMQLSSTTVSGVDRIQDYGSSYRVGDRDPQPDAVSPCERRSRLWSRHRAVVVGARRHSRSGRRQRPDVRMRQATVNLFADMDVAAVDAAVGPRRRDRLDRHAATRHRDHGAGRRRHRRASGAIVTVNGTASDTGGLVTAVEVSVDGGTTWKRATGRASWTFSFTAGAAGPLTIRSRGVDDSGNIENPGASRSITVTGRWRS